MPNTPSLEWPQDGSTVDFEDIVEPVCCAIRAAYRLERLEPEADVPYQGLDIADQDAGCAIPASRLFTAEHLNETEEDQGRDALTEIVSHAVRLGIEQGRRIARTDLEYRVTVLQAEVGKLFLAQRGMGIDAIAPIQPGDVVSISSSDVKMTVSSVWNTPYDPGTPTRNGSIREAGDILCIWLDAEHNLKQDWFKPATLTIVKRA